jgi:hypothetical protein
MINLFQGKPETDDLKSELIEIGRCELPYLKKMKSKQRNEENQAYDIVRINVYRVSINQFYIFYISEK